ncbi:tyrosine-type recombinase/integrase [Soonwooa sp.]|uniref:tyrosine-type recombinase/integrase n=1 Tax=Soonwooa sp. TaxID=1938592 RepID=UPI00261F4BDF|nr:tyrosine-type recombinase/integrase [Soonwooa sp.]
MLEKFLDYIRIEKRYSAHTITSYQKDIEDFLSFCLETEATTDLRTINKKVVRNFIVYLSEKELSKRSINRKLSSLRGFYVYLLRIGEIKVSPMESISSLKFYAEKQQPFSLDEMTTLQEQVEDKATMPLLEKLIIETLYQTGMRKAELCNLLFENVDFTKSEFKVIGKGNKQRIVPISKKLQKELQNYAEVRCPDAESKTYFFVNKKGKKLGERFVYSVVNKYLSLVTTKEKRSPHILRHSFATHVLNNGAEISKVKTLLGHSSLASTQVYTNANIEELKKVFNKAHPRAQKK